MNKVEIMFPSLQKGIKKQKETPDASPYNYVSVKNGHAIVVTSNSVICLNMEDYFLNYHTILDDQKVGFRELLTWMEGKYFTTEFWEYLTSKNEIYVIDENRISVSGQLFEKELIYHENEVILDGALMLLKKNFGNQKLATPAVGMRNTLLKTIDATVGKLISQNAIIFEFNMDSNLLIRFTIEDMTCVFGVFTQSAECTGRPFNFENFKNFVNSY